MRYQSWIAGSSHTPGATDLGGQLQERVVTRRLRQSGENISGLVRPGWLGENLRTGAGTKVLAEVALNGKPAVSARFTLK